MKWSPFRGWVHNLWVENCEEHSQAGLPNYREQEYFRKYRWWLKREYKHQQQIENNRLIKENKMLQKECRALREQLKYAEQQVYNGTTM